MTLEQAIAQQDAFNAFCHLIPIQARCQGGVWIDTDEWMDGLEHRVKPVVMEDINRDVPKGCHEIPVTCSPTTPIESIIAGIPTKADGVTCCILDVRRVLEDNPHLLANDQAQRPALGENSK